MKMHSYVAYGLKIHSVLPLPELVAGASRDPDVVIQVRQVKRYLTETVHRGKYFRFTSEEAYFYWKQIGAFLVRNGKEIIVDPIPALEKRITRVFLLGIVLSAVLEQRGMLTLHASAVALNGDAVAFLGAKGAGKSTMAAALYAQGHSFIADDTVALDFGGPVNPLVLPGFPSLKLMPEAVYSVLGDDPALVPRTASVYEKRAFHTYKRFSQRSLPLRCIFLLSEGIDPNIELIRRQEALLQLIGHSYNARFSTDLPIEEKAASSFCQCAEIAKKIPVYCLKRPRSLDLLPEIAKLVEEHVETLYS